MSEWTKIDAETRAEWRVDAGRRGGVPQPGDADPYTRYQANRITRLLDALDALDDAAERERLREAVIVLAAAACGDYWAEELERRAREFDRLAPAYRLASEALRREIRDHLFAGHDPDAATARGATIARDLRWPPASAALDGAPEGGE